MNKFLKNHACLFTMVCYRLRCTWAGVLILAVKMHEKLLRDSVTAQESTSKALHASYVESGTDAALVCPRLENCGSFDITSAQTPVNLYLCTLVIQIHHFPPPHCQTPIWSRKKMNMAFSGRDRGSRIKGFIFCWVFLRATCCSSCSLTC